MFSNENTSLLEKAELKNMYINRLEGDMHSLRTDYNRIMEDYKKLLELLQKSYYDQSNIKNTDLNELKKSGISFEFQIGTNNNVSYLKNDDPYHNRDISFDQNDGKQLKSFPVIESDLDEDTNEYESIEKNMIEPVTATILNNQSSDNNEILNENSYQNATRYKTHENTNSNQYDQQNTMFQSQNEVESDKNIQDRATSGIDYATLIHQDNLLRNEEENFRSITPKRIRLVEQDPKPKKETKTPESKIKKDKPISPVRGKPTPRNKYVNEFKSREKSL